MKKKISKAGHIIAHDCLPFRVNEKALEPLHNQVLSAFVSQFSSQSVFSFSSKKDKDKLDDKDEPFAIYDYKSREWIAGRWVGFTSFEHNRKWYQIEVKPRFSNLVLLKMIERIFSINILNSYNKADIDKQSISTLLEQLLPLIWTNKLGSANKYGVPRHTENRYHTGSTLKGRIDVRKSIVPLFRQKEVVSVSKEKVVNETIAQIILQAKKKLEQQTGKHFYQKNDSACNAILHFESAGFQERRISEYEYQKIQYKSIYESYKDIVDFSWQILKNKKLNQESDDEKQGYSLFVDMAEIWELYLTSLLKKNFPLWDIASPRLSIYKHKSYQRTLIPDIVLSNGNRIILFDAKWKNMRYHYKDFDRSDFFQIHTYISYYQIVEKKQVVISGLLYPLSERHRDELSSRLFGAANSDTTFTIDGLELNELGSSSSINEKIKLFEQAEEAFIQRVNMVLGNG